MGTVKKPSGGHLAATALAVLLLAYVGYQVYRAKYTSVRTEAASYFTASDSVEASVTALRNEKVLLSPGGGALDFVVDPGARVSKNGVVANVYSDEAQITAQHQLQKVDGAIAQLENLQKPGNTYSFNADTANGRICLQLMEILGGIRSGELSQAADKKSSLLNLLNEKQIATGKVKDFQSQLKALKTQRESLAAKAGSPVGSIASPEAGYFIRSTDGMENAYDLSAVSSITCGQVRDLQKRKLAAVSGAVGKICTDFDWYLVCVVPNGQLTGFRQLDSTDIVSVHFPFVSGTSVDAEVYAVNQEGENGEAAVVLRCSEMSSSLAGIRHETADISVQRYAGLRVSQKAIHYEKRTKTVADAKGKKSKEEKEIEGVYVLYGNQLSFRQIAPLFSTENYVICDPAPKEDSLMTDETVKLYDEVVVEGTDLYDGKVVK